MIMVRFYQSRIEVVVVVLLCCLRSSLGVSSSQRFCRSSSNNSCASQELDLDIDLGCTRMRGGSTDDDNDNDNDNTSTGETTTAPAAAEEHNNDNNDADTTYTLEEDSALALSSSLTSSSSDSSINSSNSNNEGGSSSSSEVATQLRLEGKEYHDRGDFVKAAELFQQAADSLILVQADGGEAGTSSSPLRSEEYATCRLHQALCHLKSEHYDLSLQACSDVLRDDGGDDNDNDSGTIMATNTPAVRARAYHRRAKAKLGLGDATGALQDARSAAFLGDRKAVALYGRLMRESSSSSSSTTDLQSLFSAPSTSAAGSSPNAALLESLLTKSSSSSSSSSSGGLSDFNPASLLFGGNSGGGAGSNLLASVLGGNGNGSNNAGMAKSVLQSLSKRLEDESTQTMISTYLQNTNKAQLQQLATMAGIHTIPQVQQNLDRIVSICQGVTPKRIRRTVRTTKACVYTIQLVRRVAKIIQKYKTILVVLIVLQWTKSACLRPMPIDRRAVKQAAKQALKDAMKATRASAAASA